MTSIGSLDLEAAPRIAVPLTEVELRESCDEAARWADVLELRADLFATHEPAEVAAICAEAHGLDVPILLTVRHSDQGGGASLDDRARLAIFTAAMPHVDAVDIELRSTLCTKVLALCRDHDVTSIASHHDFAATPDDGELRTIVDDAVKLGADIVKVAATANTADDRNRLLDLLRERRQAKLIVIAMGPHGAASRVFFPLCGSLLTYGFLHQAVAPGQLSARDLRAELARYVPEISNP